MTTLVRRDVFTVLRPAQALDAHGWAEALPEVSPGEITGTIQPAATVSDSTFSERGGRGPHAPFAQTTAVGYFDLAPFPVPLGLANTLIPGDVLVRGDDRWRVQGVRTVNDPRPHGLLDCLVCDLVAVVEDR